MYGQNQYGVYMYGEEGHPTGPEVDALTPDLVQYLPLYERKSVVFKEILGAIEKEFGILGFNIKDLERQMEIDTATWGLAIYEKELGLNTNLSLSYEERREIVKAKTRGAGTTTKTMIKNTAEAFSGGEVDVIDYPRESRFVVQFIGILGIPRNMQNFIEMLETIKPAHLAYSFKYTYAVWDHIKDLTWQQATDMTWNDLRVYEGE